MNDFINRNEVKKLIKEMMPMTYDRSQLIHKINMMESHKILHAYWINEYPEIEPNPMFSGNYCSECGLIQTMSCKLNYCPNCGAKMDLK